MLIFQLILLSELLILSLLIYFLFIDYSVVCRIIIFGYLFVEVNAQICDSSGEASQTSLLPTQETGYSKSVASHDLEASKSTVASPWLNVMSAIAASNMRISPELTTACIH